MGKEKRPFCCHQNFVPNGLSAPARGYIHMVKHGKKNVNKIGLQSIFLKPATSGQSDKGFLLTSKVCPQRVVCPCPGTVCIYKIIKNVYKIRFLFLKIATNGQSAGEGLSVDINICPQGVVCPCPGAIYMYESIKIYTRTRCQVSVYRTTGRLV